MGFPFKQRYWTSRTGTIIWICNIQHNMCGFAEGKHTILKGKYINVGQSNQVKGLNEENILQVH